MKMLAKLRAMLGRTRAECELDEELRFHVERRSEELLREAARVGAELSAAEARRRALVELGGTQQIKEEVRAMRTGVWLETLWQDVRFAARQLRKNPGFTVVAVLTLALGIGANTSVFSLLDAALLKRLPAREPERLALLDWIAGPNIDYIAGLDGTYVTNAQGQGWSTSFPGPTFEEFERSNEVFESTFAFAELDRINVLADGEATIAYGQIVSRDYFSGLGVAAWRGRVLGPADFVAGAEPAAVISYRYWQRQFGGDESAVGKTIFLNGTAATIVGVTPPGFEGAMQVGYSPDVTVPLKLDDQMQSEKGRAADPTNWWIRVMGRLKPGVTREQAQANLAPILHRLVTHNMPTDAKWDLPELRVHDGSRGLGEVRERYAQPLYLLLGGVVLVLLVACANVATLMLMRSEQRRKEMAVRTALGAQRSRLFRQVLVESILLASLGGTAGWVLAVWGRELMVAVLPVSPSATAPEAVLDTRVLLFTVLASLATGIFFGLAPALRWSCGEGAQAVKGAPEEKAGRSLYLSKGLIAFQVGLSVVLLVGAGLLSQTLYQLHRVRIGFDPDNVLLGRLDPTLNGYSEARLADFYGQALERLRALPGVESAALVRAPLLSGRIWSSTITVPGYEPAEGERVRMFANLISEDFLQTMRIPLLAGRNFTPQDNEHAPAVAIINEEMARRYFRDPRPLGRHFRRGQQEIEVIGVAANIPYVNLRQEVHPSAFVPYRQYLSFLGSAYLAVRTHGAPEPMARSMREVVRSLDPSLPVFDLKTQETQITESVRSEHRFANLSVLFSALALVLVGVGLVGLLSYEVTRRTREIGIRMALGGQPGRVGAMVLRQGLLLTAVGLAAGVGAAIPAVRYLENTEGLLFEVQAFDLPTYLATALLLLTAAAAASWIPARRAARIDPAVTLRSE